MIDLTGQVFGRLSVIEKVGSQDNSIIWKCKCECGNTVIKKSSYLRSGDCKSCGCLHKEQLSNMMKTHGKSKTRLYRVWAGIKARCYNENTDNYKYYGACGIKMCDEWKNDFSKFETWAMNNGYDPNALAQKCTLDRIDNSKNYSPDNCRWVDHIYQCNNQRSNKIFSYNGETHTMAEWAKILDIKYTTLRARIRRGKTFEEAIGVDIHE